MLNACKGYAMSQWYDQFLSLIVSHKQHEFVYDKDQLLTHESLLDAAANAGFVIVGCDTSLDLRIAFELDIRHSDARYLIHSANDFKLLPDIRELMGYAKVTIGDLFPCLDRKTITRLDSRILDVLFTLSKKIFDPLGPDQTIKFVLENIYFVDVDGLGGKERLLSSLTTIFSEPYTLNQPVLEFLSKRFVKHFPGISTETVSKKSFFPFLQKQWEAYILNGSQEINFEESSLNKTVINAFVTGRLAPVKVNRSTWQERKSKIGVFHDERQSRREDANHLMDCISAYLERIENDPRQWFFLIQFIAKNKLIVLELDDDELTAETERLEKRINNRFQIFLDNSYQSLQTRSAVKQPYYVFRVLDYLKNHRAGKKALVVIDGLNYWQWRIVEAMLIQKGLHSTSFATFAWIPSITAWSRQALFKGARPDLTTDNSNEDKLFMEYWRDAGYAGYQTAYRRVAHGCSLLEAGAIFTDSAFTGAALPSIAGMVCNDIDDMMHGNVLGLSQFYIDTRHWLEKSDLIGMILYLKQSGFTVFITSDHGSIEARGINNLKMSEKIGSLSRSKRHRHFANESFLKSFQQNNPDINAGVLGLSLYLRDNSAFVSPNDIVITHGGSHFWEVLVPFAEI